MDHELILFLDGVTHLKLLLCFNVNQSRCNSDFRPGRWKYSEQQISTRPLTEFINASFWSINDSVKFTCHPALLAFIEDESSLGKPKG